MFLKKTPLAAPLAGLRAVIGIGISVVPLLSAPSAFAQGFTPMTQSLGAVVCKGPQCKKS
jgi:hypothetical protein